jgi:hypothetical protein
MMGVRRAQPSEKNKNKTTSMPVLPEAVFSRSTHPYPAEILFRAGVSGGE